MVSIGSSFIFLICIIIDPSGFSIPNDKLSFLYCFGNGLIATALTIFLMLLALQYINSTKASIL